MTNQPTKPKLYSVTTTESQRYFAVEINLFAGDKQIAVIKFQTDSDRTKEYYGFEVHMTQTDSIPDLIQWTKELDRINKRMPQGFHWDADALALLSAIESSGYYQVAYDKRVNQLVLINQVASEYASLYYPIIDGWSARSNGVLCELKSVAMRLIVASMDDWTLNKWTESGCLVGCDGPDVMSSKPDSRSAFDVLTNHPFINS